MPVIYKKSRELNLNRIQRRNRLLGPVRQEFGGEAFGYHAKDRTSRVWRPIYS